jgi:hypothetical protein
MMDFSREIPLIPFERRMQLAELVAARNCCSIKPSWCGIFTKALAIVGQRIPVFRRAYLKFPRPRLYEHPYSVACVVIERDVLGDLGVIFCLIRKPHELPLTEIDGRILMYQKDPLNKHGTTRKIVRVSKLPRWLRHLGWWYQLNCDGTIRAYNSGTYGVSVTAGHGATALSLETPLTSTLHYGIFEADGSLACRMTFDHRVMDGGDMARILVELESVLRTEMLAEVKSLVEMNPPVSSSA